ncbi:MAG: hypothetical protein AAF357_00195 [Verrucomicrobiota bacterium]
MLLTFANEMTESPKFFRLSSIGSGASLLTFVLLMLGNPFLVLTFFFCIVYAVVPVSLWRKHRSWPWRAGILITCFLGFGLVLASLTLDIIDSWTADEYSAAVPAFTSPIVPLFAGVIFLPLACIGSLHSLFVALRERRVVRAKYGDERGGGI